MRVYNKIKVQLMLDWIQQLFLPNCDPIDEQFLNEQMMVNNKQEELLLIKEIHSYDSTPQNGQQTISQRKHQNITEKREENKVQSKNQGSVNHKSKRKTRPSRLNQSMGFVSQVMRRQKCIKIKKKTNHQGVKLHPQHPTKNFLQNFKVAHLDFLQTKFSKRQLQKSNLFLRLKMKNGIAMQDYRQLYSVAEFRPAFEQMFRSKYLYRSMMLSRSGNQARINHIKKLCVFEQSFRTKCFNRIN